MYYQNKLAVSSVFPLHVVIAVAMTGGESVWVLKGVQGGLKWTFVKEGMRCFDLAKKMRRNLSMD